MAIHSIKVQPDSIREQYFMDLLTRVDVAHESVICRLGSMFGKEYDEYIISDGLFDQIKKEISIDRAQA